MVTPPPCHGHHSIFTGQVSTWKDHSVSMYMHGGGTCTILLHCDRIRDLRVFIRCISEMFTGQVVDSCWNTVDEFTDPSPQGPLFPPSDLFTALKQSFTKIDFGWLCYWFFSCNTLVWDKEHSFVLHNKRPWSQFCTFNNTISPEFAILSIKTFDFKV